jgi:hypothetical protein
MVLLRLCGGDDVRLSSLLPHECGFFYESDSAQVPLQDQPGTQEKSRKEPLAKLGVRGGFLFIAVLHSLGVVCMRACPPSRC